MSLPPPTLCVWSLCMFLTFASVSCTHDRGFESALAFPSVLSMVLDQDWHPGLVGLNHLRVVCSFSLLLRDYPTPSKTLWG